MKKIFIFVLLFLGSTMALVGASEVVNNGTGISGEKSLDLWFHTAEFNQGSNTFVQAVLTNNEASSSAYGEVEAIHIESGLDSTLCHNEKEVFAGGDEVVCDKTDSDISGDVTQGWGRWTDSSTSSVNTSLWIY